ncbi:MAG: DNA topoisomerase I, partial [Spirochaetaceae bacterium]|nr:DNA topoisomerase I [Spirochaetaceae bacterium]
APADLTEDDVLEIIEIQKHGPVPIGHDPDTGEPVFCLIGRYGPYVQLGEKTDEVPKPRRATLPKEVSPKEVTLEIALKLLSLPRVLGRHPETGNDVVANNGRFGPYVVHDGDFRSLKATDDVYSVLLERALEILAEPKKGRGSKLIRDLGTDEKSGMKIGIYEGRYGPYIKFGKKNITLPEEQRTGEAIEKLQLSEAMEIVRNSGKV